MAWNELKIKTTANRWKLINILPFDVEQNELSNMSSSTIQVLQDALIMLYNGRHLKGNKLEIMTAEDFMDIGASAALDLELTVEEIVDLLTSYA